VIFDVEGQETHTEDIGVLEYDADTAPASGLRLFIGKLTGYWRNCRPLS
jgi:hypothetical protein